ncbi:serine hydrolase domain-containing protein [Sphingomonas colocasiae]|uniref:Serine hydrolase n=1 Tax=Sphingomonas colocasiae TaxID=1848973 RepID=A0ABS7PKT7_9SPHN|nr:serine hydrolase domain-containing protein [Sphingomonas colocasiae]MBY8821102.1 serine hydrolase [Sphingomonas colocasiae]
MLIRSRAARPAIQHAASGTVAVMLSCALALPAMAQSTELSADQTAKIDAVFAEYAKPNSAGCAAGVMRDGRMLYAKGYGMADIERGVPITPASVFDIGSTSKQFAAASILLLQADGKLKLTDDARKYVPELPDFGKTITIDHLIHHTSGLRDYIGLLVLAGFSLEDVTGDAQVLSLLSRQRALNFPTGSRYEYSNTGYFLLSVIVQRVSGKNLAAFARERIFAPLGMSHTLIRDNHAMLIPNRALGYAPDGKGGFVNHLSNWEQLGDGAVQVSVDDMLHWEGNFLDPKVGGAAMVDALQTPGALDDGKPIGYARGLSGGTYRGQAYIGHGGAWQGYRAMFERFPKQRVAIAVFCNSDSASPNALSHGVADVVLADVLTTENKPGKAGTSKSVGKDAAAKPVDAAPYVGSYFDATTDTVYRIAEKDGGVVLDMSGRMLPLVSDGPGRFSVKGFPATLSFEPAGKRATGFGFSIGGEPPQKANRFEPITLAPDALRAYAGNYYSPELDATLTLTLEEGKLAFRSIRYAYADLAGPLSPAMNDTFEGPLGFLTFKRDASGRISGFGLSASRMKAIAFERRD